VSRFLSTLLILVLVFTVPFFSYAAEDDSTGLEKAIKAVKEVVKVDKDYTVFSHSVYTEDWNPLEKGTVLWSLQWQDKDNTKSIFAQVDGKGTLREVYTYDGKPYTEKPGSLNKEKGDEMARAFLKKVMPKSSYTLNLDNQYSYGSTKNYVYSVYVNGAKVDFVTLSVNIDSETGEVKEFYSQNLGAYRDTEFSSLDKVIGKVKAKDAYISQIGNSLAYVIYEDYQKRTASTFLSYAPSKNNLLIDANTGKVFENKYLNYYGGLGGMGEGEMSTFDEDLSPLEQEAVDSVKKILSKEEARAILTSNLPSFKKTSQETGVSLMQNPITKQYIWSFSFEAGYGQVDGETGEILAFSRYVDYGTIKGSMSEEKAVEKALAAISKYAKEKVDKVSFDGKSVVSTGDDQVYYLNFSRMEKGIRVIGNGIEVTVPKNGDELLNYQVTWNKELTFEDRENIVTEEEAFDVFDGKSNYNLSYVYNEGKVVPCYKFIKEIDYFVDPVSKELLDFKGEKYREVRTESYPDILGKWYEKEVMALLEYGHFLDQDTFNGNDKITQESFLRYLYSGYYYLDQDDFYKALENEGKVKKEEKAPESNLLRKDAAKFAVRYIGLAKAAEQPQIYQQAFTDYVQKEYKGYAALAKALSIMKGDKRGRFLQNKETTNAEAAVIIYNTLNAQ